MSERWFAYLAKRMRPYLAVLVAAEVEKQLKRREKEQRIPKQFIGGDHADRRSDPGSRDDHRDRDP